MKCVEVSLDDGRACAALLTFLGKGRWDLSAADAESLVLAKRWLASVATEMAGHLKSPAPTSNAPAPSSAPMKIKSMGPIGKKKK